MSRTPRVVNRANSALMRLAPNYQLETNPTFLTYKMWVIIALFLDPQTVRQFTLLSTHLLQLRFDENLAAQFPLLITRFFFHALHRPHNNLPAIKNPHWVMVNTRKHWVNHLLITPECYVATGFAGPKIFLTDTKTGLNHTALATPNERTEGIATDKAGKILVSTHGKDGIIIWDLQEKEKLKHLTDFAEGVAITSCGGR